MTDDEMTMMIMMMLTIDHDDHDDDHDDHDDDWRWDDDDDDWRWDDCLYQRIHVVVRDDRDRIQNRAQLSAQDTDHAVHCILMTKIMLMMTLMMNIMLMMMVPHAT